MLLSPAATARDIYAVPALLGFSLLIALWASESGRLASLPGTALRWTRRTVALLGIAFAAAVQCRSAGLALGDAALATAVLGTLGLALRRSAQAQRRGLLLASFGWT